MATVNTTRKQSNFRKQLAWGLVATAGFFFLIHQTSLGLGIFPEAWNIGLREPLNEFQRWMVANRQEHWLFVYLLDPLSDGLDGMIRTAESALLWLPWPTLAAFVFLLAHKIAGLRAALLTTFSLLAMGLLGLWDESMATLALMLASVIVSLLLGLPLGVWTARNDRVERVLRPVLDAMQTMPVFAYLIPVVLFFGVARVPSMIATVIYALPPAVRLTNLGIRSVSEDALEAARSFGSTERQILYKVQIPLALPTIMAGVNQTIMMALGIVVIASLIGAGGLGDVVLRSLRRLQVGQAFEAGLAIVFMAILLDRLSYALSQIDHSSQKRQGYRLMPETWANREWVRGVENLLDKLYRVVDWPVRRLAQTPLKKWSYWLVSLLLLIGLTAVAFAVSSSETTRFGAVEWSGAWMNFPEGWRVTISTPIDAAVDWAQINLYEIFTIGEWAFGIGPFSDFLTIYILRPLIFALQDGLSWPVVMLLVAAGAYGVGSWRLMLGTVLGMVFVGLIGMWENAMTTLAQVIVAVVLAVIVGIPVGILSARSDTAERLIRPILDLLQTIPPFVYLVPVIMLFNIGSVPGIIASVLYALPPVIRLTNLGIRGVDKAAVEAAESFGSTQRQTLFKVQLPLALPSIMLGVNQTVMMVLAMVIIAGLIGGAGLGFEVISGFTNNRLGQSVEAGVAIVIMAIVIDRITQAWAEKRREAANI